MNYEEANAKLGTRERRKLHHNTYLERRDKGSIAIRLHNTDIITFRPWQPEAIEVDSGGWRTPTTKERMNRYLSGWRIEQENGQWFISRRDQENPYAFSHVALFADGARLHANGTVTGAEPLSKYGARLKLRRRVQRFAAAYMAAFAAGKVPPPGAGDCFYCWREAGTGTTLGEVSQNDDHLLSHIAERYFVPSLLANAFTAMPHSQAMGLAIAEKWLKWNQEGQNDTAQSWANDLLCGELRTMLGRYILRQLGQAA